MLQVIENQTSQIIFLFIHCYYKKLKALTWVKKAKKSRKLEDKKNIKPQLSCSADKLWSYAATDELLHRIKRLKAEF